MKQQRVSSAGEEVYNIAHIVIILAFIWLRNQLKLVSYFMYHDDDDVPVLHDFIRFHYQYPAFPTAL